MCARARALRVGGGGVEGHIALDVADEGADDGGARRGARAVEHLVGDDDAQGVGVDGHAVEGGEVVLHQVGRVRVERGGAVDALVLRGQALERG